MATMCLLTKKTDDLMCAEKENVVYTWDELFQGKWTSRGQGAHGSVFRVFRKTDVQRQHPWILKLAHENSEDELFGECVNYAQLRGRVPYMCVPHVEFMRQHPMNQPYLVLDECNQGHVMSVVQSMHPSMLPPYIMKWSFQLFQAVEALHGLGFMHRDIKPYNIMIHQGEIRLGDLGSMTRIAGPHTKQMTTLTHRAPEVCRGSSSYDEKIDIYAVGVVMAEMCIQDRLFSGCIEETDPMEHWETYRDLIHPRPDLHHDMSTLEYRLCVEHRIPRALYELIEACMREEPHERPSATECLRSAYFRTMRKRK
jgi:serine/threonine protein kinase